MNWWVFAILFAVFLFALKGKDTKDSSWPALIIGSAGLTIVSMSLVFIGFKILVWLFWPILIACTILGLIFIFKPEKKTS
ncbi:MAG: hypothetical protein AAB766_02075 [Patescibacteria group bacterium]